MGASTRSPRVRRTTSGDVGAGSRPFVLKRNGDSSLSPLLLDVAPVVAANTGDHALIHLLLLAVHQAPSREEFQASLDYPQYEPTGRLLIRSGSQLVGHVRLVRRLVQFGEIEIPATALEWLAVLPEYRTTDYRHRLVAAAESEARADGAELVTAMSTDLDVSPEIRGWIAMRDQGYSVSSARDTLAQLSSTRYRKSFHARVWRHVEIGSLIHVYQQQMARRYGLIVRSDAYWHWLCSRKAYDQILVAIEGRDTLDYGPNGATIVGYAVVAGERIVELITLPGHRSAAVPLLAHACRDAMERNRDTIALHAPPTHPLHELMITAGGSWRTPTDDAAGVPVIKVLQPSSLVRRLYPRLHEAAKEAGLSCPLHLGLKIDGQPHRFTLSRRSARLVAESPEQVDLRCSGEQFSRLLLGCLDVRRACEERTLSVAKKSVTAVLAALFPTFVYWKSPLDDWPA